MMVELTERERRERIHIIADDLMEGVGSMTELEERLLKIADYYALPMRNLKAFDEEMEEQIEDGGIEND